MKNITLLGAGMVGRAMAIDLSERYKVNVYDNNTANLVLLEGKNNITAYQCNFTVRKELQKAIKDADLVVGAVPGFLGFETLKQVIENGKNVADISFFPEDALQLDALAKKNKVTAVVDCGVAPGMDNILYGYHYYRMKAEKFVCMVGGLPKVRSYPFQYKAPFSPVDVLEEYTRPARLMENGKIIVKPALSEPEFIEFENAGTLEAFNTDGLRSLLYTMPAKDMKEITLRYPGHRELMQNLSAMGFFSNEEIEIRGTKVKPIDVTAKLFFPKWKYAKGEKEFTVMRIIISGTEKGKPIMYEYDLYDEYDDASQTSSMARTTGYTCTAVASMILEGEYTEKGIIVPEYLGKKEKHFKYINEYLRKRGIHYKQTISFTL
jgi:lysine 6-dehydrogenase